MLLTPLDILLIIICIFLLLRFLAAKKHDGDDSAQDEAMKRRATDAYKRAERAWDMLRDEPDEDEEPENRAQALRGDFDPKEFLSGAKMAYARIRESWDARDLDDLVHFTTPRAHEEFVRRAEEETRPPRAELLLVNASLVERRNDGVTQEATVLFDVTLREGADSETKNVQDVWKFVCGADDPHSHWKLDAMQKVEDTFQSKQ